MHTFHGSCDGSDLRIAIITSRFNEEVTTLLTQGAIEGLKSCDVSEERISLWSVPGAYEIPIVAKQLCQRQHYDAIVCLGAVIRGETAHFEYVAGPMADALQQIALEFGIPIGFGVLTTEDDMQAFARAGGVHGNKGYEAAVTAVEMANLLKEASCNV